MKAAIREYDGIGRYGGEEFLLVLPHSDAAIAMAAAERVQASFNVEPIATPAGAVPVTVSIGIAANGGGHQDARVLIHAADLALYRAKNAGRNRIEVASADDFMAET